MADIALSQLRGAGFTKDMKGISAQKALEILRKHKTACRSDSDLPKEGAFLEIIFESTSEIPSEFEAKKYLLVFEEPDTAMKIYENS